MITGVTEVKKVIEGGLGLAFFEGSTVFLPFTAPGDRVEFSARRKSGNILFSRVEKVLEPSGMRIEPECPNFTICPGCEFLHINYSDELEIKRSMTEETFSRIGKLDISIDSLTGSTERFGCKNSVLFEFSGDGLPGLRDPESGNVIPFPPDGCPLLSERTAAAVQGLSGGSSTGDGPVLARTDRFGETQFWGAEGVIELPDILIEAAGNLFPVKPATPVSDNIYLMDRFLEAAASMPVSEKTVLSDTFCGVGMLSLAFARRGFDVTGIDENKDSIEVAKAAARLNSIEGADFVRGRVERMLMKAKRADLIAVSSPAGGISKPVHKSILKNRPVEILINSADAASMARDIRRLMAEGYLHEKTEIFDLYPGRSSSRILTLLRREAGD